MNPGITRPSASISPRQVLRKNKSASTYPYSGVVTRKGNPSRRSTRAIFCARRPNKFRRGASSAPRNTPSARVTRPCSHCASLRASLHTSPRDSRSQSVGKSVPFSCTMLHLPRFERNKSIVRILLSAQPMVRYTLRMKPECRG